MDYQKSLKRFELLKGHISPTNLMVEEAEKATFNVDAAREHVWSIMPDLYF